MRRLCLIFLFVPLAFAQVGCSSTPTPAADNTDASGNSVSSVPWNKPESWETTGQLGGMSQ